MSPNIKDILRNGIKAKAKKKSRKTVVNATP